ncbi:MAG TPA: FAD-dependent oxidoreductase [Thermoanaerobaculia bacterium]|nr:FAD-dependent oxidoreductase [Thermoanaerobaculia bacterium]
MSDSPKWTRRTFLEAVGRAGGAAAVYETMVAMGMVRVPTSYVEAQVAPDLGRGKHVVILGAGIAGLTAAYRLHNAGYKVSILEAKDRAGGRSYTVRRGYTIEENTGTEQICRFDEGPDFYLNAGPGRLPYHHTAILHYCTLFRIPLEVYTMMTRANFFQRDGSWQNKAQINRRIANDTRGYISELLAKAVLKNALDQELEAKGVDRIQFLNLLSVFGDVESTDDYDYRGSSRSGYEVQPGIEACGDVVAPLTLGDLVSSGFWNDRFYQAEEYEWQPTLFQPVGGMDKIWREGFLKTPVAGFITYEREVTSVANVTEEGKAAVRVEHRRAGSTGKADAHIVADYCISTIPLPILSRIDNNFSQTYIDAIETVNFADTCKVGWQTNSRFWETKDEMYGGISYTTDPITQIWYPSWAYFKQKGILTGAYNYDLNARHFGTMTPQQRLRHAMNGAKKLHPEFDKHVPMELGLSIAWQNVPYQLGGWADDWGCDNRIPEPLLRAEGRFWVAGDQVSYLSGWQEGAVRSANHVVEHITGVAKPKRDMLRETVAPGAAIRKAPSVRRRTRGLP